MSKVRTIRVFSASPGDFSVERPGVGWHTLARTHLGHPQRVTGAQWLTRQYESSCERRPTCHSLAPTAIRGHLVIRQLLSYRSLASAGGWIVRKDETMTWRIQIGERTIVGNEAVLLE